MYSRVIQFYTHTHTHTHTRTFISNSLWPYGLYSPWNSPGQNTGVSSHSLLQGIFPTHGSNPGLPHCRWILYQLSHRGSPPLHTHTHPLPTHPTGCYLLSCVWLFATLWTNRLLCPRDYQARILEWVAIRFSKRSSCPRDRTPISHIAGRFFTTEPAGKPHLT